MIQRNFAGLYLGQDGGGDVVEDSFHSVEVPGADFDEGESEFLCHLSSFYFRHLPFLGQIVFVADQQDLNVGIAVVFHFLHPVLDVVEGFPPD